MPKKEEWETKKIDEDNKKSWLSRKGELVIDVYKTANNIVIQAPIAGIKKDELDIVAEKEMVSIRGNRGKPKRKDVEEVFTRECFWGEFSREIILPEETDTSRVSAEIKEGILTIRVPRINIEEKKEVELKEDE